MTEASRLNGTRTIDTTGKGPTRARIGAKQTGNPECSQAMSTWVRGRKTGIVSAAVYAVLGKCRAQANMLRKGSAQRAAGNEAKAQVLEARAKRGLTAKQRVEKARQLQAQRKAKAAPKPVPAPAERHKEWALETEAAKRAKAFRPENAGAGRTGTMFDMKRGDKPGQTSIFDKVKAEPTHGPKRPITEAILEAASKAKVRPGFEAIAHKPLIHDVYAEFIKTREGAGMSLAQFKALLASDEVRGAKGFPVKLGRIDLPQAFPIGPQVDAATWKGIGQKSSPADHWHTIERPNPTKQRATLHRIEDSHGPKSLRPMKAEKVVEQGRKTVEQRQRLAARLKAARADRNEHTHPETHGKVGKTYDMDTSKIHFDPERFQYKLAAQGSHGTTDALKDVKKWNPDLAGTISVWRDPADGKTYVINGHHRLDLANKLGAGKIKATYINAPNHVEARAHGAMVNIAEGRGTSVDAAKFFRDRKIGPHEAAEQGVSLREHTASQGLAMAGLSDHAFKRVVSGELKPARAAIIGGSGLSHDAQHQLLKTLDQPKNRNLTDATVQNMVHGAHAAGNRKVAVHDLFGSSEEEQSLFVHRATAESAIKRALSEDKRLFGLVSRSKAATALQERGQSHIDTEATGKIGVEAGAVLHLFDELKHRDPHISRPLNEAAERIANGENPKTVHADARAKVTKRIKGILEGGTNPFE